MIAFTVELTGQLKHSRRTELHAKATAFAPFLTDYHTTLYFSGQLRFFGQGLPPSTRPAVNTVRMPAGGYLLYEERLWIEEISDAPSAVLIPRSHWKITA